jgi:hypothetical protein
VICGPDVDAHVKAVQEYADAGYDHVCIHQVGPDQAGFFAFYEREVLPRLRTRRSRARRARAAQTGRARKK